MPELDYKKGEYETEEDIYYGDEEDLAEWLMDLDAHIISIKPKGDYYEIKYKVKVDNENYFF